MDPHTARKVYPALQAVDTANCETARFVSEHAIRIPSLDEVHRGGQNPAPNDCSVAGNKPVVWTEDTPMTNTPSVIEIVTGFWSPTDAIQEYLYWTDEHESGLDLSKPPAFATTDPSPEIPFSLANSSGYEHTIVIVAIATNGCDSEPFEKSFRVWSW